MLATWQRSEREFGIEGIDFASMTPDFYEATAGVAAYETTAQAGAAGTAAITPKTHDFVDDYRTFVENDDDAPALPMEMGFGTYDAVLLYREAVETAGTVESATALDDIVDAMLSVEFTGAAGPISLFGPSHEYPHDLRPSRDGSGRITNYPVTQWRSDGSRECVYPASLRTGDHLAPPWL